MVNDTQLAGHVTQSLGIYVLGTLPAAELSEVHAHLSRCADCRADLRSLREAAVALALLSIDEAEALTAQAVTSHRHLSPDLSPVESPATGPLRPSRQQPDRLPPTRRWFDGRRLLARPVYTVAAAAALAVVLGFTAGWLIKPGPPVAVAVAAAYSSNRLTGVSMSASAYAIEDTISIRASVSGLQPNESYLLYVVTSDSVAHLVQQWSSPTGSKVIDQELDLHIGTLAYFVVIKLDGTLIMLAWCQPTPTPGR